MERAPLFNDVTTTPLSGQGYWLSCADGVRIRAGVWADPRADGDADRDTASVAPTLGRAGAGTPPLAKKATGSGAANGPGNGPGNGVTTDRGTVLLFPGRTEYVEKYGPAAAEFAARGYATVAVDWRGQGLADRLGEDRGLGHVRAFADYQTDVRAVIELATRLDLPRPWFLLGHSMGGAIAFRALIEGLAPAAACLSAPMLGIRISAALRPIAWGIGWTSEYHAKMALSFTPGSRSESYVATAPFDDNMLTTDRAMYKYMRHQIAQHPDLALGGPSIGWVYTALRECRALERVKSPAVPSLCFVGSREKIVDTAAIHRRAARWPEAELIEVPGGEHEVMMEAPALRRMFFDRTLAHFDAHR